jgi:hypothetical protein
VLLERNNLRLVRHTPKVRKVQVVQQHQYKQKLEVGLYIHQQQVG